MREKLLSKLMLLLAFLLVGAGNAWADSWVKTAASDLQTGDVVAIVDETSGSAMSNDKGTSAAPSATEVTITDGEIASVAGNLQWVVTISDGKYSFNARGSENVLYCTNTNNGVRVGSGDNATFTFEKGGDNDTEFLKNEGTSRYIGVYNNQDWRCYTSINNNIKGTVLAFYKNANPAPLVETVATPTFNPTAGEVEAGTKVAISCTTEGATIYYTTDGSVPTTESAKYEAPIKVTEAMTIKAIAVAEGKDNSAVATAAYTIKEEVVPVEDDSDLTLDFTTAWTAGEDNDEGEKVFTSGNYTISGKGSDKFDFNSGYFIFGKSGAYVNLPKVDFPVAKIEIVGNSGASGNTVHNIYVGDDAVSEACTGMKGTSVFEIAEDYQVANTQFILKITSAHNGQITYVKYYKKSGDAPVVTVKKPVFSVAGGSYNTAQNVEISCETEGAKIYYTLDGSEPTASSNEYTGAISVTETTTIKAIAVKDDVVSSVASATYTIVSLRTIAQVRAQGTGNVMTKGIVTSCSGTGTRATAYIQDATAAICVYGKELTVGDEITVSGALTTYNGLLEITSPEVSVLSSGNTVEPTVKTIAEINADYAGNNALQGLFVKIEEATVTAISGNNTTIAQGENSIVVFKASGEFAVDDVITLEGNIGCYNAAQIVNPQNITVKQGETPAQTVATPTFSPEAGEVEAGKEIVISCATEGATIYYTLDESDPTAESTKYTAPITVNERTVIKAIAMKEGMTNSAVATAEYTIKEEVGPVEGDADLTLDFTKAWTEGEDTDAGEKVFTSGNYTISGKGEANFRFNGSYFIFGKSGAYVNLPKVDFAVEKIEVVGNSAASGNTVHNIYVGDDAVSEACTGMRGTSVFAIAEDYQVANTQFVLKITSAHNGQITYIKYYKKAEGGETSTAVATTVTIDATGVTNTNLFAGTAAGKLTAIVKAGDKVIEGAVVAWESDNEDVASVGNDGTVTLESDGTAVITATYAGVKDQYKPSEATYTLTVTNDDPNAAGTADNPYTVAQARAAIDAGEGLEGVYAKGIVSEIVTAFNSQYGNITYNISEDGTKEADQLQAYRGLSYKGEKFTSADDIKVGDIVVVYGNLKKYNTTYEFDANNQLVSLERVNTSISADNVDIAFDATTGAIAYTIDNPTDQGVMSATTTSDWLTLANDFSSPIAFTCETNSDGVSRTAIVTLTYTFGNEKVTKEVTVTQAGNPDVVNNISDITEVDVAYSVRGTVVATNARGFVIGDGTGYVYYYKSSAPAQAVGDKVSISGTTGTYGQIIQFTSAATVAEAAFSNYNNTPAATVITEVPDYTTGYHLSTYLQFEGKLTKNGSNYLIALGEDNIQISYPTEAQQAELGELEGKTVQVKGYFSGINSSGKFTTMLESIEEVITNDPFINAEDVELEYDATTGEIAFTIDNPVTGTALTASATADWITWVAVNGDKVIFATTANEGDADRTATITLVYGEVTKDVTVTQKHYVVDYATLPFVWEGGAKDVFLTVNGVTANGLGSDYAESNAPYRMKFDTTGDYIQVKTNAQPGRVTIGVKMIGGSNESKITVQGSADGEEFTDVQELTISGSQNSVLTLATTKFFAEDCRYVRLVFTKGSNVGIGAISIDEPISYVEATVGEAGYATFCSSWALELPQDVTAYIVSAVSESDVTLTEVTAIPANTPVILKAEANNYELPIIEDADAVEGNMLLASDGTVQGDGASIFALGNKGEVGFYLVANGVTVPAGKAYLVVTAAVRDFLAFANGEADGINAVDNGQFAVGNVVYDLSGRRVEKAVKGIYIVNGKKVVK